MHTIKPIIKIHSFSNRIWIMKRLWCLTLLLVVSTVLISGQAFAQTGNAQILQLKNAIELFSTGRFSEAALLLSDIYLAAQAVDIKSDALYWLGLTQMALEKYDEALKYFELYLSNYPGMYRIPEVIYQMGRCAYFKKDYEKAIQYLTMYLTRYPEGEFAGNSIFWYAETLFDAGKYKEAEALYNVVITKYPSSTKAEASKYKLIIIGLKYREEELLKLLRWSHEEALKTIDEFQRREKIYEQAIAAYQRQLTGQLPQTSSTSQSELLATITNLNKQIEDLTKQLALKDNELKTLQARAQAQSTSVTGQPAATSATYTNLAKLLALKEQVLLLMEFYLQKMIELQGAKK